MPFAARQLSRELIVEPLTAGEWARLYNKISFTIEGLRDRTGQFNLPDFSILTGG